MSNTCKCGLEFGAPATLRIHQRGCAFLVEDKPAPKKKATKAKGKK